MKISLWYALREFRRRPKRFLSLTAVSTAILCVLILSVLWESAVWRAEVMPTRPENYHFSFYNLTEADKDYIKKQSWVLAVYDLYTDVNDPARANEFRVRVKWEYNAAAMSLADSVYTARGLEDREPYASAYAKEYVSQYQVILREWYGADTRGGLRAETVAAENAHSYVMRFFVRHDAYLNRVINNYAMQPSFLSFLLLLSLFLGAAILILNLETYRSNFREYGTLRTLGFTKVHIFFVNLWESLFVNLSAIPAAILITAGLVQLYYTLTAPFSGEAAAVYFTIAEYVPVPTLGLLAGNLLGTAVISTAYCCFLYREKSVISLIKNEDSFTVPFVAKTSPLFEKARGIAVYCRLYIRRARAMLIRYTAVLAVMLPLPMYYLIAGISMLTAVDSPAEKIRTIYISFQIAAVLLTTLAVTYSASRMLAHSRVQELSVIRALGGSRKTVRRVTYPVSAAQAAALLLLTLLVNACIGTLFSTGYSIGTAEGRRLSFDDLFAIAVQAAAAVVFVLPSAFSGLLTFLCGFFRRPIITSLRDTE